MHTSGSNNTTSRKVSYKNRICTNMCTNMYVQKYILHDEVYAIDICYSYIFIHIEIYAIIISHNS